VEAEERHAGIYPERVAGNPDWPTAPGGYAPPVIGFYSRRLGCLGSVVLSLVLTACLILLLLLL
jgi:hypothetical protein